MDDIIVVCLDSLRVSESYCSFETVGNRGNELFAKNRKSRLANRTVLLWLMWARRLLFWIWRLGGACRSHLMYLAGALREIRFVTKSAVEEKNCRRRRCTCGINDHSPAEMNCWGIFRCLRTSRASSSDVNTGSDFFGAGETLLSILVWSAIVFWNHLWLSLGCVCCELKIAFVVDALTWPNLILLIYWLALFCIVKILVYLFLSTSN